MGVVSQSPWLYNPPPSPPGQPAGHPAASGGGALPPAEHTLPETLLQLNTARSHFSYFHDQLTPLPTAVLSTLSAHSMKCYRRWTGVVGAVVGRDDAAIREDMYSALAGTGSHDDFPRRVQLDEMPIQTAMLLLRIYHYIQRGHLLSAWQIGLHAGHLSATPQRWTCILCCAEYGVADSHEESGYGQYHSGVPVRPPPHLGQAVISPLQSVALIKPAPAAPQSPLRR